jgi:4-phosphopantoate--beta-alanine ligase
LTETGIPADHPRRQSLLLRETVIRGWENRVVASAGLIAHGRGEAYDYLLGEETQVFARTAVEAAACRLLASHRPVLSVNGNAAALCARELVELAEAAGAALEINLFYRGAAREQAILRVLRAAGAGEILGVGGDASATIPELGSMRRRVDPRGILAADTVLVPLEDGDRTEALVKMGKQVITIDLNPLSRTARSAGITIVDNVVRALPALVARTRELASAPPARRAAVLSAYDNRRVLADSLAFMAAHLQQLARKEQE